MHAYGACDLCSAQVYKTDPPHLCYKHGYVSPVQIGTQKSQLSGNKNQNSNVV